MSISDNKFQFCLKKSGPKLCLWSRFSIFRWNLMGFVRKLSHTLTQLICKSPKSGVTEWKHSKRPWNSFIKIYHHWRTIPWPKLSATTQFAAATGDIDHTSHCFVYEKLHRTETIKQSTNLIYCPTHIMIELQPLWNETSKERWQEIQEKVLEKWNILISMYFCNSLFEVTDATFLTASPKYAKNLLNER